MIEFREKLAKGFIICGRILTDLKSKADYFQNRFDAKQTSKDHIDVLHYLFIRFTLFVEFHHQ